MADSFDLPANGSFSFNDRTALITGGGRGVGEAIAREIHAGGGRVAVSDVDLAVAQDVAASLDPSGASAVALQLDVREKGGHLQKPSRLIA